MKTIGFIPARYGSTRFPGKPLVNILGKSMLEHVYENSINAKLIDKVIVLTDDDRIFKHVTEFGGEVLKTSSDITSGTERIYSVLNKFSGYDTIVNIQGDEPLLKSDDIDKAINLLKEDSNADIGTLAVRIDDTEANSPNVVKVVIDKNDFALYFSRAKVPYIRDNKVKVQYLKHIGLYIYKIDVLRKMNELEYSILEESEKLEQLKFMENGYKIKIGFTDKKLIGVDCQEDIDKVIEQISKN